MTASIFFSLAALYTVLRPPAIS